MNKGTGTCGFCGYGDGWLGEQGDESTQMLLSAVRRGNTIDDWKYDTHPNALWDERLDGPGQHIVWCGHCVSGLAHKFQRLSDHNLRVRLRIFELWNELDGAHWSLWDTKPGNPARAVMDDVAIHIEKVGREAEITDMQNEVFRRAGVDLTTDDWRA